MSAAAVNEDCGRGVESVLASLDPHQEGGGAACNEAAVLSPRKERI